MLKQCRLPRRSITETKNRLEADVVLALAELVRCIMTRKVSRRANMMLLSAPLGDPSPEGDIAHRGLDQSVTMVRLSHLQVLSDLGMTGPPTTATPSRRPPSSDSDSDATSPRFLPSARQPHHPEDSLVEARWAGEADEQPEHTSAVAVARLDSPMPVDH